MTNPPQLQVSQTDLDALVEKIEEAIEVHEGHCLSYVSFYPDTARRFATAITSLRNQLTASEARERELREALERLANAVVELPVEEMVQDTPHGPELLGYCMQAQGEWDEAFGAAMNARALTNTENHHGS